MNLNEWTSYNTGQSMTAHHAPLSENNMKASPSNLKSILAGCPDNALPTNEELLTDDCLSIVQAEIRQAGLKLNRSMEEFLLKQAIRWYIEKCKEAK